MYRLHKKNFQIPSVGKEEREGERFPISFITSIFWLFPFLGRMAEVTEHPTCNQKVPSSNPVWTKFFFQAINRLNQDKDFFNKALGSLLGLLTINSNLRDVSKSRKYMRICG